MLNFNSIMIGSGKPKELAAFYEKVFGRSADMDDGGYYGWKVGEAFITVYEHSQIKGNAKEGKRIMFNFETVEVKEEFERIKAIVGAEVIQEPYEMGGGWVATLADPDGNYFQLMSHWDPNSN